MSDWRFNAFYLFTSVTFVAFVASFSPCLFEEDSVMACVAVSREWVEIFRQTGWQIVKWVIAFSKAAFGK